MADDEEENPKRFSPQCFLLDFYKSFTAHNKDQSYGSFIKINEEPSQVVNKLLNKKDGFAFNELTPAQMSNLVPKFRLYKTYASGEDKEFYFDDHTSIESLGASGTKTTYSKYQDFNISPSTKPIAVGLKTFTWEDLGTNPANKGLTFKANMVVSCPSMQSLFVKSRNGLSFDELICPGGRKKTKENPEYDNKHNRFRADVGWVVPSSFHTTPEIWGTKEKQDELKSAINASQISLFLNTQKHELSINEDGTIELSMEFMASLEAGMFSPKSDLFYLGKIETTMIKNHKENIKRLEKQIQDHTSKLNAAQASESSRGFISRSLRRVADATDLSGEGYTARGHWEGKIEDVQDKLDEQKKIVAEIESAGRLKKYQGLLTAIAKQKRFFSITLTAKEMEAYKQLNKLYQNTSLTSEQIQAQRREIIKDLRLFNADYRPNPINQPTDSAGETPQSEIAEAASRPVEQTGVSWALTIDNRKEQLEEAAENIQTTITAATDPSDNTFNYIYMGDLLEAAFGIVRKNQIEEGDRTDMIWRFMVGQLKIYDFEFQKYQNVNVADFPISWDYFNSFFLDKVIKPERQAYNIRQFVKDIISELLVGALSPLCFGKMSPEARTKVNTQVLSLPSYGDPHKPFPAGGVGLQSGIFNSVDGKVKWTGNSAQSHNYLFIYPVGGTNYKWKGDYAEDYKNNILHLQLGADRGLLKSVSFKRQDMPGQREANIQKTVDSGGVVGNLLFSNKYNADLTLYGNTLFTVGTTLYLDPKGLGIGGLNQPNSMAQKLGVGGYYSVTKAHSSIESGKFETSLTTILQGLGNKKNKKADTINTAPPALEETTRIRDNGDRKMNDPTVKPKPKPTPNTGIST